MHRFIALALLLGIASSAHAHESAEHAAEQPSASLRAAFDSTLAVADRAIHRYGVTDSAMIEIQAALARLALQPSLKDQARLQQIHGSSSSNAALLASRGDDNLSLFLSRFQAGHATPVHDHQTWGVLHVLEGRDHYIHWSVDYQDGSRSKALTRMATGMVLGPGSSVYWLPPPHDLHSQVAMEDTVWELLLAGRNFLSPSVLGHRHYFDTKSGDVTPMPQK